MGTSLTYFKATKVMLTSQIEKAEGALKEQNEKLKKEEKNVKGYEDSLAKVREEYKDFVDNNVRYAFKAFQNSIKQVKVLRSGIQIPWESMDSEK